MLAATLRFSIQHRYLVILLTLAAAAGGAYSLLHLPIDAVPDITNNQVQINTLYASLSPAEIEKQITFPIETALAGIPGLQSTRSLSRNGFSQVTAIFDDSVNIYFARQQVGERLLEARESLPPGAEPRMGTISTGLGEVYMWTVEYEHPDAAGAVRRSGGAGWQIDGSYITPEGEHLVTRLERAAYLRTVQDWIIRPQLKGLKDVAGVDSIGGYIKQYHVQPNPRKLVAYGLTFHDIVEALERNNVSIGAGYIEHKGESYLVRAAGRIRSEAEIENIVLRVKTGKPVYVRHVADVSVGRELRTGSASENGHEVVVGTALMLIGANSRTVSLGVDDKLREINKTLPPDIRAKTVLNRTRLVDATIQTVSRNLFEGAILVMVVLFLLLGNIRAAIITAIAIPLSMLLTAIGMVQTRVSGNLMSLGAIDFGLIVDGAVIIVENCVRMLAEKQHELGRRTTPAERLEVVVAASRQVLTPAVSGIAIIITVYLPILTLTGIEGKMFYPMAMTVIFALVAAFILSLTFVPAMAALGIAGAVSHRENLAVRWTKRAYEPTVRLALRFRKSVVAAAVAAFIASIGLFAMLGQEFVPTLDENDIALHAIRIPSTSLTQSSEMQFELENAVSRIPEVAFVFSKTGTAEMASDPMPPNLSDAFVIFKPRDKWANPALKKSDLIQCIAAAVNAIPGSNYEFTQPIQMRFNELIAGVRGDVAVNVFGDEFEQIEPAAQRIAATLRDLKGSADVKVEQTRGLPVMNIEVDRALIARYGLNMADVQEVIAIAIGGRKAGVVFQGDRRFDLVVRLPESLRRDIDEICALPIPLPRADESPARDELTATHESGIADARAGFVRLGAIAKIDIAEGPNQVSRENGKRRVVVQCNVRGRDIGSFVAEAQRRVDEQARPPAGAWLSWGGQFENMIAARHRLMIVVPICFFLIFILLFSTFNSVKYAALVFTGVPLALTGGIVSLWLRGMSFSISAAVGFIALSGVAVLNGLVMITFINQLRAEGIGLDQAITHGCMTRLRPVLMTALVAALGFIPMALATGTGAEVQRPLATVVIGGIFTSTLLTLVVLPALYRLWHAKSIEPPVT